MCVVERLGSGSGSANRSRDTVLDWKKLLGHLLGYALYSLLDLPYLSQQETAVSFALYVVVRTTPSDVTGLSRL